MDTYSFIIYIKRDDIYKYIAEDFKTTFDSSNYELDRSLLNGEIMTEFVRLTAKTHSHLKDDGSKDKKAKGKKKSVS